MEKNKYLGIDIGGTSLKVAIVSSDKEFEICEGFKTGRNLTKEGFIDKFISLIKREYQKGIVGVGISTLGFVDSQAGTILRGVENMPYLEGINFKTILAEYFPDLKVSVINDGAAAALGEKWAGAATEIENYFCITFGTGIGGCLVLNGKAIEGANYRSGEIGFYDYMDGTDYLEMHYSTKAVMDYTGIKLGCPNMDGITFFKMLKEKHEICVEIFENWMKKMARVIANVIIIIDVEAIIIGGGISEEKELIISHLTKYVEKMLPTSFRGECKIQAAKCANNAGILGAIYHHIEEDKVL